MLKHSDLGLAIKACDDEIALAQTYIQEISAQRNALLPIIQFPSEILGSIFRFLLPVLKPRPVDSPRDNHETGVTVGTRSLISASHVCRRWREVALEHSTLWTTLWIENTPWMHEMLSRSRGIPLTIIQPQRRIGTGLFHTSPTESSAFNMDFLTSRLFHEIQPKCLYLYPLFMDTSVATLWDEVLVRPAPNLETLEIIGGLPPSCPGIMSVPADLLGRRAPALKSLTLAGSFSYEALWPSPILHQLVSLTLDVHHMNGIDMNSRVPLQDVLNALREMRQLENLSITFPSLYIRSSPETAPFFSNYETEHPLVQLPRLSSLYLSGALTETSSLTARLVIPRNATTQYAVILREDEIDANLTAHVARLLRPVLPFSPLKTSEVTFMHSIDRTLNIRCWDHILPAHISSAENFEPRVALGFSTPSPPREHHGAGMLLHQLPQAPDPDVAHQTQRLVEILRAVSSFMTFDQIHDLRWSCHYDLRTFGRSQITIDEPTLADILSHFAQTKRLFFTDTIHCPDMITATASDASLLPHLTGIHFVSTLPRKEREHVAWPAEETRIRDSLRELANTLRRLAETRDIQTLHWGGGLLPQKFMPLFDGIAKQLVWE